MKNCIYVSALLYAATLMFFQVPRKVCCFSMAVLLWWLIIMLLLTDKSGFFSSCWKWSKRSHDSHFNQFLTVQNLCLSPSSWFQLSTSTSYIHLQWSKMNVLHSEGALFASGKVLWKKRDTIAMNLKILFMFSMFSLWNIPP